MNRMNGRLKYFRRIKERGVLAVKHALQNNRMEGGTQWLMHTENKLPNTNIVGHSPRSHCLCSEDLVTIFKWPSLITPTCINGNAL